MHFLFNEEHFLINASTVFINGSLIIIWNSRSSLIKEIMKQVKWLIIIFYIPDECSGQFITPFSQKNVGINLKQGI